MSIDSRLDKEIELIENDLSLTPQQKEKEIRALIREAREIEREMYDRDRDEREDRW